ncbi:unnamed protein product [Ilex paraguariensis]|uniref:Transmembrane protein n=1 Tax=Ilex paraguariensis TaxID=185542 RepID=A0ABC8U3T3_9AQUA
MAKSVNSTDPCSKLRQINQVHKNKKTSNSPNHLSIPSCRQSRSTVIHVIIFIAFIGARGFLLYPSMKLVLFKTVEIVEVIVYVVKDEIFQALIIYERLGLRRRERETEGRRRERKRLTETVRDFRWRGGSQS